MLQQHIQLQILFVNKTKYFNRKISFTYLFEHDDTKINLVQKLLEENIGKQNHYSSNIQFEFCSMTSENTAPSGLHAVFNNVF